MTRFGLLPRGAPATGTPARTAAVESTAATKRAASAAAGIPGRVAGCTAGSRLRVRPERGVRSRQPSRRVARACARTVSHC